VFATFIPLNHPHVVASFENADGGLQAWRAKSTAPHERTRRGPSSSVNAFVASNAYNTVSAFAFDVHARTLACACSRARAHARARAVGCVLVGATTIHRMRLRVDKSINAPDTHFSSTAARWRCVSTHPRQSGCPRDVIMYRSYQSTAQGGPRMSEVASAKEGRQVTSNPQVARRIPQTRSLPSRSYASIRGSECRKDPAVKSQGICGLVYCAGVQKS
jgi:hypothetical protein